MFWVLFFLQFSLIKRANNTQRITQLSTLMTTEIKVIWKKCFKRTAQISDQRLTLN